MTELRCWNCGVPLTDIPTPISRQANCPACFNELHCCRLCTHFDSFNAADQCDEDRADPPVIKDGANFCEWFNPNPNAFPAQIGTQTGAKGNAARAQLDALFDNQPGHQATESPESAPLSREDEVRAKLDRLFSEKSSDETDR